MFKAKCFYEHLCSQPNPYTIFRNTCTVRTSLIMIPGNFQSAWRSQSTVKPATYSSNKLIACQMPVCIICNTPLKSRLYPNTRYLTKYTIRKMNCIYQKRLNMVLNSSIKIIKGHTHISMLSSYRYLPQKQSSKKHKWAKVLSFFITLNFSLNFSLSPIVTVSKNDDTFCLIHYLSHPAAKTAKYLLIIIHVIVYSDDILKKLRKSVSEGALIMVHYRCHRQAIFEIF